MLPLSSKFFAALEWACFFVFFFVFVFYFVFIPDFASLPNYPNTFTFPHCHYFCCHSSVSPPIEFQGFMCSTVVFHSVDNCFVINFVKTAVVTNADKLLFGT